MNTISSAKHLFPLGCVVITPAALTLLERAAMNASELLQRHVSGDWGALSDSDKAANREAVSAGLRIMSQYDVGDAQVWIITEADRSATTILLPGEY